MAIDTWKDINITNHQTNKNQILLPHICQNGYPQQDHTLWWPRWVGGGMGGRLKKEGTYTHTHTHTHTHL